MSNNSEIVFEKERDFSDKINITFAFVIQNFKSFFWALLCFTGPLVLLSGIFAGIYQTKVFSKISTSKNESVSVETSQNAWDRIFKTIGRQGADFFSIEYFLTIVFSIIAGALMIVTVQSYLYAYKTQNRQPEIGEVWEVIKGRFWPICRALLIVSVIYIIMVTLSGVIIWGFTLIFDNKFLTGILSGVVVLLMGIFMMYCLITTSLIPSIMTFENIRARASIRRAFVLIKNKWWSTFGLIFIMSVIRMITSLIFGIPAVIIPVIRSLKLMGSGKSGDLIMIFSTVVSVLGSTLLIAPIYVSLVFQYFNLLERKEGKGLLKQVSEIGLNKIDRNEEEEY
ncbi:hypothetical protein SAMN04515674_103273 [Pseudarcicella hirudinis]|uniref:Membrane domain of glycerophosphoryl diester phosphodiesterase n=1 Tax=Pseudarcicella hirudinis TaxID=1079859 RepID=A0A1I5QMQ4_9BACT|nr:hypothetical protein [Pseudarcicella hirudinis]SFP47377.1 hypothetical protein SAMN04515674_103273 [Pseudarcicella hirudinis]